MLIIDPLMAIRCDADANKDQAIRSALQKLKLKTHYEVDEQGERRYYWSTEAA